MKMLKNKATSWLMSKFNIGKIDKLAANIPLINLVYKSLTQKMIDYDFPTHLFIESN